MRAVTVQCTAGIAHSSTAGPLAKPSRHGLLLGLLIALRLDEGRVVLCREPPHELLVEDVGLVLPRVVGCVVP